MSADVCMRAMFLGVPCWQPVDSAGSRVSGITGPCWLQASCASVAFVADHVHACPNVACICCAERLQPTVGCTWTLWRHRLKCDASGHPLSEMRKSAPHCWVYKCVMCDASTAQARPPVCQAQPPCKSSLQAKADSSQGIERREHLLQQVTESD